MEQGLAPPLRFAWLSAEAERLSDEIRRDIERGGHGWRAPFVILYCELSLLVLAFVRVFIDQVRAGELDGDQLGGKKVGAKMVVVASGEAGPRGPASPDAAAGSSAAADEAGRMGRAGAGLATPASADGDCIDDDAAGGAAVDLGGVGEYPIRSGTRFARGGATADASQTRVAGWFPTAHKAPPRCRFHKDDDAKMLARWYWRDDGGATTGAGSAFQKTGGASALWLVLIVTIMQLISSHANGYSLSSSANTEDPRLPSARRTEGVDGPPSRTMTMMGHRQRRPA